MRFARGITIAGTLLVVVLAGTVFFHIVEGWSWLDSYFFTVITISTVGYGELVPITALGKIGTTVLIFGGLGVFAAAIHEVAQYHMRRREAHAEWLIARLGHEVDPDPSATANTDSAPDT